MKNDNNKDSEKYQLFDELESGSPISQESLDSLEKENQELFDIFQKSNLLRKTERVKPDPFYSRVSQIRIYYQLLEELRPKPKPIDRLKYFIANLRYPLLPSLSLKLKPVLTILLTVIFSLTLFVRGVDAADNARPGQFLYPVDRALETVQLFFTTNEESRIRVHLAIAAERLEEAQTAYQEGDFVSAETALAGYEQTQITIRSQIENTRRDITEQLRNTAIQSEHSNRTLLNYLLETVPESSQAPIISAIETTHETGFLPPTVAEPPVAAPTPTLVVEETPSSQDEGSEPVDEFEVTEEPTPQPTPTLILSESMFVKVWVHSVNVRAEPGLDKPVVGWLFQNQTFFVDTCENGFVFIPEFSGWASGTCFDPNPCGPPGSCSDIWD